MAWSSEWIERCSMTVFRVQGRQTWYLAPRYRRDPARSGYLHPLLQHRADPSGLSPERSHAGSGVDGSARRQQTPRHRPCTGGSRAAGNGCITTIPSPGLSGKYEACTGGTPPPLTIPRQLSRFADHLSTLHSPIAGPHLYQPLARRSGEPNC
jgi:hypothetical protein